MMRSQSLLRPTRLSVQAKMARASKQQAMCLSCASDAPYQPADPKSLNWTSLGFGYVPTAKLVLVDYDEEKGGWQNVRTQADPYLRVHSLSNAFHYGQSLFEGLKAFAQKDGNIRLFRPDMNAKRMEIGGVRLGMPPVPKSVFLEAVERAVKENAQYVPPYGSGGSLYLRPFYFGHGPQLGLGPAKNYTLGVWANPVGNYYPLGVKPVEAIVLKGYDRAAPLGVGSVKAAGNYAADVHPSSIAKKRNFPVVLYLDAKSHKYIEEFSTSNFVGISSKSKTFVTPESESILKSVTNDSLQQIARDMGYKVEKRQVAMQEVRDGAFKEIAACGTAVVITPISRIFDESQEKPQFVNVGDGTFPEMNEIYTRIRAIQNGEAEDVHKWLVNVCPAVNKSLK